MYYIIKRNLLGVLKENLLRIVGLSIIFLLGLATCSCTYGTDVQAQVDGFGVVYSGHFDNTIGWSNWISDNHVLSYSNVFPTAIKISLEKQPEGMSGTVQYQINSSGSGWLEWAEAGAETGFPGSGAPIEALKVKLNGELEAKYDIYTRVYQSGTWTDWVKNGETAGTDGVGTHIDAVRVAIMPKDGGVPEEIQNNAAPQNQSGRNIDPNRPMVALTYDDGPNAPVTNRILNSLEAVGGRATFFVVGSNVHGRNATIMKRAFDMGCEIGNHTYRHENLTKLSAEAIKSTISSTDQKVIEVTGTSPSLVRPPYGAKNASVLNTIGKPAILWSIDTLDWKTKNASSTINAVLNHVKDGDVILMHDIYGPTADASETIIPELVKRGYQLVTVTELASYRGGLHTGKSYGAFRK